jgi:hypothetical protein
LPTVRRWRREWNGRFGAADYSWIRSALPDLVAHMPRSIPSDARNVRIYAPTVRSFFPAPDHMIELRFIVPSVTAAAIQQAAAAKQITATFGWQHLQTTLSTAEDEDPSTPLGPGFVSYLLVNPSGSNIGGVTVNVTTGEVIYWFFES